MSGSTCVHGLAFQDCNQGCNGLHHVCGHYFHSTTGRGYCPRCGEPWKKRHRDRQLESVRDSIVERLLGIYKQDGVDIWMTTVHGRLVATPEELIAQGRAGDVLAEIEAIETGAFS